MLHRSKSFSSSQQPGEGGSIIPISQMRKPRLTQAKSPLIGAVLPSEFQNPVLLGGGYMSHCCRLNCVSPPPPPANPQIQMLEPVHLGPGNMAVFRDRAFEEVVTLK